MMRLSIASIRPPRLRLLAFQNGRGFFHIELSSRHRPYLAPARFALIGVCAVLAGLIAWSVIRTVALASTRQALQERLSQVEDQERRLAAMAHQEGLDISPAALKRLPSEVSLANQLLAKRNFSWTQFLTGLEEAIPSRVAIKSVRLDPGSAFIHLTGAALTVEDVTALALKLQHHPVFHDPVLGQHHAGADGLVEFDLSLKYRPRNQGV